MKNYTLFFLIVLLTSCNFSNSYKNDADETNENKVDTTKIEANNPENSKSKYPVIRIGYYDTYKSLKSFKLDSIEEKDFNKIKSTQTFSENRIQQDSKKFYIQTANQKMSFEKVADSITYAAKLGREELSGHEYLGYNSKLNLYALRDESVTLDLLGFAEMILIDGTTNYQYIIESLGDWSVSLPVASENNKFMVYYQNPEVGSGPLSIAVLKINDKQNPKFFLKEYASCFIENGLSIEEIRWKGDSTLFIKAYRSSLDEDSGYEVKTYAYFSAKIN